MLLSLLPELIIFLLISSITGYLLVKYLLIHARRYDILDRPHLYATERGRSPAPYGIGIAITMMVCLMAPLVPVFFDISDTLEKKLTIILILVGVIGIVSALDDLDTIGKSRVAVPPIARLMMQIGIGLVIGITSIKISYVSSLFGGITRLDEYYFQIEALGRLWTFYYIPILITMFWYVLVFNSINFSDGIPGLTGGFSLISFVILACLALKLMLTDTTPAAEENSEFILIILAIIIPVTLIVTYHDIHRTGIMGDSGTIILAFFIATLSIIAGGKIATAMSVIGIYLIDFVYVIGVRIMKGKNPMRGDQTHHLHYRLLELGLTPANIRNIIYILAATFGISSIFLDTGGKLILFACIAVITLSLTRLLQIVKKK